MSAARTVILDLTHGVELKYRVIAGECRLVYGPDVCQMAGPMLALPDRSSPTQLRFNGFPVSIDESLDPNTIEIRRDGRVLAKALIIQPLEQDTKTSDASRSRRAADRSGARGSARP